MTKMFRARSVRAHFLLLYLGTVIPLALVSAAALFYLARAEFRSVKRGLQDTAKALAAATDRELLASITTLQALASSELFDQQKFSELHKRAIRVLPSQPGWRALFCTIRPGITFFIPLLRLAHRDQGRLTRRVSLS